MMQQTQEQDKVELKIERRLMVRSLDEWVMETGAVSLNSSWHSEMQSIVEMAFNKGAEVQAASAQAVPVDAKQAVQMPHAEKLMEQIKEWAVSDLLASEAALDAHCPDPPQSILDAEKRARDLADAQLADIEQQVRAMLAASFNSVESHQIKTAAPAAPVLKPLTDDEVFEISRYWSNSRFAESGSRFCSDFARAIERAHGITGAPNAD